MRDGGYSKDGLMKLKSFQIKIMNVLLFQERMLQKVGPGLKSGRLTIQEM